MAADLPVSSQTPPPTESKTARKKKAKAEATVALEPERKGSPAIAEAHEAKGSGEDGPGESHYIKELHNKIRNINKRLNALHKTEEIVKSNPDSSLNELVASRKINPDQKAAIEKKPMLLGQLAQVEEQLAAYKKFDQEYQAQIAKERELMQSKHKEELEQSKSDVEKETEIRLQKQWKTRLLTFSRFLSAVARRRQDEDMNEEGKAFEAILQYVYSGDPSAVTAAEKLIDGVEEQVPNVDGAPFSVTYARIKTLVLQETPQESEDPFSDEVPTAISQSDPTVTTAGLTEAHVSLTNGSSFADDALETTAPAATSIGAEAGNAIAESSWDAKAPGSADTMDPLAESYEIVPRDPAETDTPHADTASSSAITGAANASGASWADDATATGESSWADDAQAAAGAAEARAAAPANGDGFQAVHHGGRGRGQRTHRGEFRGGRGRGDGRGRPFAGRGDGRGRGRGARGEAKGPRRGDAAQ